MKFTAVGDVIISRRIQADFARRCESYGTKLCKNPDGTYECDWQ